MEADSQENRANRARFAQKRWRLFAFSVPVCLLLGIVFYGTLSSMAVRWTLLSNAFVVVVVAGIILLRSLRRMWLRRYPARPSAALLADTERRVFQFLHVAWAFAAALAVLGFVLFLFAAPRQYPLVFEFIAAVYFALYYPRQTFFDDLLWYPDYRN